MSEQVGSRLLQQELLKSDIKSLAVRPAFAVGWWSTSALGLYLPTAEAWNAGKPQAIASHISRILQGDEATLRIYAEEDGNFARRTETHGHLFGWTRARHQMMDDPIEAATVIEIADIPVRWGRTLPLLRFMEHGNPEEEFVVSLSDLAHYVQHDRAEIAVT
jgi:hypothetical protein